MHCTPCTPYCYATVRVCVNWPITVPRVAIDATEILCASPYTCWALTASAASELLLKHPRPPITLAVRLQTQCTHPQHPHPQSVKVQGHTQHIADHLWMASSLLMDYIRVIYSNIEKSKTNVFVARARFYCVCDSCCIVFIVAIVVTLNWLSAEWLVFLGSPTVTCMHFWCHLAHMTLTANWYILYCV